MPWITGTDVPQELFALCPRCRTSRLITASQDGTYGYSCSACEWDYTFGVGTTVATTNNTTSAGGTALPFASGGTGFSQGQYLWYPGATAEIVLVTGVPTATSVPVSPLQFAHATAQAVSVAVATLAFPNVGVNGVPNSPGWGF